MKSFDYPVKDFEKIVNDLETFYNTLGEKDAHWVSNRYLHLMVIQGKKKNWDSFVKFAYPVVKYLEEKDDPIFSILKPIKVFGDEKRKEKGSFIVSLFIKCITIRDVQIKLCAKFRDHPFFESEDLREETIPSIPESYYVGPNVTSTRRPFYENRLLAYKYAPNKKLLLKMDEVIKELKEKGLVKSKCVSTPRVETSTTLYNKEESFHQLTYTSYLYDITIEEIEKLFSPLFDKACGFLKGTPRDVVIIQDHGMRGKPVLLYPNGKYIPSDKYKEVEEE